MTSFDESLGGLLEDRLSPLGFRRYRCLEFIRGPSTAVEILNFGSRKTEQGFSFSFSVGIRFERVEEVLRPESSDLSYPTIMMPIHLLHEERKFFEWFVVDSSQPADSILDEVVSEVENFAEPFFRRFRTLRAVKANLESNRPIDWFVLSSQQRVATLAAIFAVMDDKAGALAILDLALEERINDPPKKRRKLEILRGVLSS